MKTTPRLVWICLVTMSLAACGSKDAAPQEPDDASRISNEPAAPAASNTVTARSDDQTTEEVHLADEMKDPDADQPAMAEQESTDADTGGDEVRTFSEETADEVTFAPKPSTSLVGSAEEEEFRQRVNRHNERVRSRSPAEPAPTRAESPAD